METGEVSSQGCGDNTKAMRPWKGAEPGGQLPNGASNPAEIRLWELEVS